jgi:tetratricopeptide (TPR) repeat protein
MTGIPDSADVEGLPSRALLRQQFLALLAAPVPAQTVVRLTGARGSGKTQVLGYFGRSIPGPYLALPPFDFSYADNFRPGAIEGAIVDAFSARRPEIGPLFDRYRAERDALGKARTSRSGIITQQRRMRAAFQDAYNQAAELERAQGRPLVLLFDGIEHAVEPKDGAIVALMGPTYTEANWGGEYWLNNALPALDNTLVVLAGRPISRDGTPVVERLPNLLRDDVIIFEVAPLLPDESVRLVERYLLRHNRALPEPGQLERWLAIADGSPHWLGMLATAAIAGLLPPGAAGTAPAPPLGEADRRAIREELTRALLLAPEPAPGLPRRLALMAWLRKGLSRELLQHLDPSDASDAAFALLATLPIVRTHLRPLPVGSSSAEVSEPLLFLSEDAYADVGGLADPPADLVGRVIAWYTDVPIHETNERRVQVSDDLLNRVSQPELAMERHEPEIGEQLRWREQLVAYRQLLDIDRLFYTFLHDPEYGLALYNLTAYNAILQRQYGHNIMLRQEGLRNLYRIHHDKLPLDHELEYVARWVLRAAHTDPERIDEVLAGVRQFEARLGEAGPAQRGFLWLALAQARLLSGKSGEEAEIARLLAGAAGALASLGTAVEQNPWLNLLVAQVDHWRGVAYARGFAYPNAVKAFRQSYATMRRFSELSRGLQAQTLTELAVAYAEQGNSLDGRKFGELALHVQQRLGSPYHLGLSFQALAVVEIRGGRPRKCLQYAQQADALIQQSGDFDSRIEVHLVLAEAMRKAAEDLDFDRPNQRNFFEQAFAACYWVEQQLAALAELSPKDQATLCHAFHLRGVLHRSRGLVLDRQHRSRKPSPDAAKDYADARYCLQQALTSAINLGLAPVICLDIAEDLAAVSVHEERFDDDLQRILAQAEGFAPGPYQLKDIGPRKLSSEVPGFLRELGQCQLQRMMTAFGTFEAELNAGKAGAARLDELLTQAGTHMALMAGYLIAYSPVAWMLSRAEQLTLRELQRLFAITPAQYDVDDWLDVVVDAALDTCEGFRLDRSVERWCEDLVLKTRRDRDFVSVQ